MFGGRDDSGSRYDAISVFNLNDENIDVLNISYAYNSCGAAAVGNKIYLFGGSTDSSANNVINSIFEYDISTNTLRKLSTVLPIGLMGIKAVTVGDRIYLFGGTYGYSNSYGSYINTVGSIYVFKPANNTLETLEVSLPSSAYFVGAEAIGTNIYLFGGYYVDYASNRVNTRQTKTLSTIYVFDTVTNTIKQSNTTLPQEDYGMATAVVGTKVYLFGGVNNATGIMTFDAENETIITLDDILPVNRKFMSACSDGLNIYLFGGVGHSTIFKYIISYELTKNHM